MQRPTSVTVFGILNLAFGALGLCGVVFTLASFAIPQNPRMVNPVLDLMHKNAGYRMFLQVTTGLGLIATLALILSGAGLLKLQPWARTVSIVYGVYSIGMGVAGVAVNYFVLLQPLMKQAGAMPAGPQRAGLIGGAIGGTLGGCLGVIYPVVLLVFMFRPTVVRAFQRNEEQAL